MADTTTVVVTILDKDFEVACAPDEVEALKSSAHLVDRQMQAIRNSGKVIGFDRVAVMAALNIANDLLGSESRRKATEQKISALTGKLQQRLQDGNPAQRY